MKHYDEMTGYKATDKNMQCRGFQYELGKWHKHEGKLTMCNSGFHFCQYPSGVWDYYKEDGTRVFEVKARNVICEYVPGAALKLVCSELMFLKEISVVGHRNTGDWNTGNSNTGHRNTGDWNTGHRNTGDWNTGDWNTGDWNAGHRNTGHRNTGDWNTGHWNTGNSNTGHCNTGDWNTGDWNTGNSNTGHRNTGNSNTGHRNAGNRNTGSSNTGHWNVADRSCGVFCLIEPCVISFDIQTDMTMDAFLEKHPEARKLGDKLMGDESFDYAKFSTIPGWTLEKCKALHERFRAARAMKGGAK